MAAVLQFVAPRVPVRVRVGSLRSITLPWRPPAMNRIFSLWLAAVLLLAQAPVHAAEPGALVSAAWLQSQLGRAELLVLDASPPSQHRQGHIPGAVPAGFMGTSLDPGPAEMERLFRAAGVSPERRIVVVDGGGTYFGPRLVWDLLHAGFPAERVHLLDGGMARWRAAGGAVTREPTPPAVGSLRVVPDERVRVRLPEFLAATAEPARHVMLEALDPPYFYGGAAFFNRGGHVPHATLMPSDDLFNADKTFKSPAEMQRLFDHLGVRREQQVNTYCGGGGAAAVPFFVLHRLLGYPNVRLFQESQHGWLRDPRELPMWTYGAPHLVRDTPWLKGWANPMLRAFGIGRVAVLDVRSAEQFKLGHVPLAVNVPAEVVAAAWARPEAMAALAGRLGAAGVDPRHEAVVVGDGGLEPNTALAWLTLQRLGQQHVSIWLDNLDRWAEAGHEVVRPSATPAAAAPVPAYGASAGAPKLLATGSPPAGAMPRVYIASGDRLPSRPPQGPLLHLPYKGFLDAQGRPKPAHEIWAAMAKAGVPRYAELVMVADSLGEAAVNLVIFKLMGLADVKLRSP
jgi:thiosulfate/3-mercaptopyruvate sulfurtransferase